MKIAVVTDSTAYLPQELRDKHNIHMIPLTSSLAVNHTVKK